MLGLSGVILDVVLAVAAIVTHLPLLAPHAGSTSRHFHQPEPGVFVRPEAPQEEGGRAEMIDWGAFVDRGRRAPWWPRACS